MVCRAVLILVVVAFAENVNVLFDSTWSLFSKCTPQHVNGFWNVEKGSMRI